MYREQEPKNKLFGLAADFYRARILTVGEELPADLEWREDILLTSPKAYPSKLKTTYRIQVIGQARMVFEIANLRDRKEAKRRLRALEDDLRELTKMKFDEKYSIAGHGSEDLRTVETVDASERNTIFFTGVNTSSDT